MKSLNCVLITLLLVVGLQSPSAQASDCSWGRDTPGKVLLDFLRQHSPSQRDTCIDQALALLKPNDIADSDIPLISGYLDHERELDGAEKKGFVLHPRTDGYMYPATSLLFQLSNRALPELTRALVSPRNQLTERNAFRTWQAVFRDDPPSGVQELLLRAKAADAKSAERLRHFASVYANSCSAGNRERCLKALNAPK